jgi:hypothetical protein
MFEVTICDLKFVSDGYISRNKKLEAYFPAIRLSGFHELADS